MASDGDHPIDRAIRTIRFGVAEIMADATARVEAAQAREREAHRRAKDALMLVACVQSGTAAGFAIGDQVVKHTGDYQLAGEVRARFTTKAGKVRYVVEHEPGFLHIYGEHNLRAKESGE